MWVICWLSAYQGSNCGKHSRFRVKVPAPSCFFKKSVMTMLIDFHIHSNTSIDSDMTVKEIYERAAELGIKNICITNHHEPYEIKEGDFRQSLTKEKLDRYKKDVKEVQKDVKVNVSLGIEFGYAEGADDEIRQFLKKNRFDFVLGSLHHINGWHIGNPKTREKLKDKDPQELYAEYFRCLKKAIKTRLFDVMSHIDLYKRVVPEPDFETVRKEWEKVAELLVQNNVGFEINTSYAKIVPDGTYPSVQIIKLMLEKGVKLITIGSDAHKAEYIGSGIEKVEAMLKSIGVEKIYRFEKRKAIPLIL